MNDDKIPEEYRAMLNTPELRSAYLSNEVHHIDDCLPEEERQLLLKYRKTQTALHVLSYPVLFIIGMCKLLLRRGT